MYHILSLDGGGIRGVLTAALLERLQAHQPDFLGKVDLFAGTSTGGVLALGLAYGLSPAVCRRLYEKRGSQVFADTLADDLRDLGNAAGAGSQHVQQGHEISGKATHGAGVGTGSLRPGAKGACPVGRGSSEESSAPGAGRFRPRP